jgi:hypothetical protein
MRFFFFFFRSFVFSNVPPLCTWTNNVRDSRESIVREKCLVVHSHPTHIPPLCTWTNNVRDSRESIVRPYPIIGPSTQGWDMSGMRVYNQAFLLELYMIEI